MTPEEERLARRAAELWGDPFSPEVMAQDSALKAQEREGLRTDQRHSRMEDWEFHNEDRNGRKIQDV